MNIHVVSNFRIDSDIRLQRMKDSFKSFKDADISSWHINVRGSHAHLAAEFLKQNIARIAEIACTESGKGWFHDTSKLVQDIDDGYILYWIEDHISTVSIEVLNSVLEEVARSQIDQIQYSFFSKAKYDSCQGISSDENQYFRIVDFSDKIWGRFLSNCEERKIIDPYLVSLASIMSTQRFQTIVSKRDPLLRRHSKHTPFDFEKSHKDIHWLPLRTGFLRTELFANIDTDHDGLSLISRGLYRDSAEKILDVSAVQIRKTKVRVFMNPIFQFTQVVLPKRLRNFLKRISFHLR